MAQTIEWNAQTKLLTLLSQFLAIAHVGASIAKRLDWAFAILNTKANSNECRGYSAEDGGETITLITSNEKEGVKLAWRPEVLVD